MVYNVVINLQLVMQLRYIVSSWREKEPDSVGRFCCLACAVMKGCLVSYK